VIDVRHDGDVPHVVPRLGLGRNVGQAPRVGARNRRPQRREQLASARSRAGGRAQSASVEAGYTRQGREQDRDHHRSKRTTWACRRAAARVGSREISGQFCFGSLSTFSERFSKVHQHVGASHNMLSFAQSPLSFNAVRSGAPSMSVLKDQPFCKGLPGAIAPLNEFDPLGFSKDVDVLEVNRLREAELAHGRVGMLSAAGFLVQEKFHPLFSADGARHLLMTPAPRWPPHAGVNPPLPPLYALPRRHPAHPHHPNL
jgi:hypothetical protein